MAAPCGGDAAARARWRRKLSPLTRSLSPLVTSRSILSNLEKNRRPPDASLPDALRDKSSIAVCDLSRCCLYDAACCGKGKRASGETRTPKPTETTARPSTVPLELMDLPSINRASIEAASEWASLHARLAKLEQLYLTSTQASPLLGKRVRACEQHEDHRQGTTISPQQHLVAGPGDSPAYFPSPCSAKVDAPTASTSPPRVLIGAATESPQLTTTPGAQSTLLSTGAAHIRDSDAVRPPPPYKGSYFSGGGDGSAPSLAPHGFTFLADGVVVEAASEPRSAPEGSCDFGPSLACTYLASGHIAVLHAGCVALWEHFASDSIQVLDAHQTAEWRHVLTLDGPLAAGFDMLAGLHDFVKPAVCSPALLAACGRVGNVDGEVVQGTPTYGASIFRLPNGPSPPSSAAPPRRVAAARHVLTPHRPRCAQLLLSPVLDGVDDPEGTLLALGSDDGVVRLWRLTHPISEAWVELPKPHFERPQLTDEQTASPSGVLALCVVPCSFGLLVGGFAWGAALWQVGSRTLVNIFEREGHPTRPLQNGLPADVDTRVAALVCPLPVRLAGDPLPAQPRPGDELGSLVVGNQLSWVEGAPQMTANEPPLLARQFVLTRRSCEPFGAVFRGLAGPGSGALVRLASSARHVAGTCVSGVCYLWSARTGECIAALRSSAQPLPCALAFVFCSPHGEAAATGRRRCLSLLQAGTGGICHRRLTVAEDPFEEETHFNPPMDTQAHAHASESSPRHLNETAAAESQCLVGFSQEFEPQLSQSGWVPRFAY
jgi:hypothetical protein